MEESKPAPLNDSLPWTEALVHQTPIGALKLVANAEGICAVKWDNHSPDGSHDNETHECTVFDLSKAKEHLRTCQKWLDAYFDGTLLTKPTINKPPVVLPNKGKSISVSNLNISVILHQGPFFQSVWDVLLTSGVGDTITYKELASRSGKPSAARAAGNAVRSHSIPILVPCHRVVKSARAGRRSNAAPYDIGQYSGGEGSKTKQWLLQHEQDMLKNVH